MSLWSIYKAATVAATPLAWLTLSRRVAAGKEDSARLPERWGRSALERPPGLLVWLHGASVGESLSLVPLVERLLRARPGISVLVTTGTVTSAKLMAERLPAGRAWHQFAPIDHPGPVRRFLDHWQPDLAVWVESELWPNLVLETRSRGIPMALVNARMSERSWRGWRRAPGLIGSLLRSFSLVLAQDANQAARLQDLGAERADTVGDLKAAGGSPPASAEAVAAVRAGIGNRPVWLAASTHAGEEAVVAEAHKVMRRRLPRLLTIMAPRHPARAGEVTGYLQAADLAVTLRTSGVPPAADTDVWLIDTLGELGVIYRVAPLVLVAGSLGPLGSLGGHNPLEAAAVGCALLHGPDTQNCAASTASLDAAGAALQVDAQTLAEVASGLLADPGRVSAMGAAARRVAEAERGVADAVFQRLLPLLPLIPHRASA